MKYGMLSMCLFGGQPGCMKSHVIQLIGTGCGSCKDSHSIASRPQMLACRVPGSRCMLAALHCTSIQSTHSARLRKRGPPESRLPMHAGADCRAA